MKKVYEVSFDNQREPENYGLYSSKAEAFDFLKRLNITKITYENGEHTFLEGGYHIKERLVT